MFKRKNSKPQTPNTKIDYEEVEVEVGRAFMTVVAVNGEQFDFILVGQASQHVSTNKWDREVLMGKKPEEPEVSDVFVYSAKSMAKDFIGNISSDRSKTILDDPENPTKSFSAQIRRAEIKSIREYKVPFMKAKIVLV